MLPNRLLEVQLRGVQLIFCDSSIDPFGVMWHMRYIHSTVNLIKVPVAEANKLNKHKKG